MKPPHSARASGIPSAEASAAADDGSFESSAMVIDGDEAYRDEIVRLISESGDRIHTWSLSTIDHALEKIADGAVPDVVFLDVEFSDGSGLDGMAELQRVSPSTEFVFLTDRDDDDLLFQAVCHGAAGYLLKNESAEELMRRFQEVRAGGAAMGARLTRRVLKMCAERIGPRIDYGLTDREVEILTMMVKGLTKKRMAAGLFLSYHTIDTHIKNIYQKLHVHSRAEAVVKAIRENII